MLPIDKPMIIAHRGAKEVAPENTLDAFQIALKQGCNGIELDVHLSSDGEIIVCHDETLDRTTNGKGTIIEKTLSEIKSYDAGLWFDDVFKGAVVPTLAEVFDLVPEHIMINIEVKDAYGGILEQKLIEFLRQRDRFERVVVSSFDHHCVRRIKQAESKTNIGLLYQLNLLDPVAYARSFDVKVYSLHPHYQLINPEKVAKALDSGFKVYPYTVNDEKDMLQLTAFGVSGIITDSPERLKRLLTEDDLQ